MQFKKSILLPIVLSVIGIFVSVLGFIMIQVAAKVNNTTTGASPLAIVELVLFVLMLSALSAKKPIFTKVVCIIAIAALLLQAFIVCIVSSVSFQYRDVQWDTVSFLSLGVLCLVAVILFLIYYLIGKKDVLKKLALIMNIFVMAFYFIFAAIMGVSSFAGVYATTRYYGIELAVLLLNVCLMSGIVLSLQGNLETKEEE
ncbi:MAG: hypothetical protein J5511_03575 [Bacilli bacterium]|nr:hypothetical protein [Bacilli bacterium]